MLFPPHLLLVKTVVFRHTCIEAGRAVSCQEMCMYTHNLPKHFWYSSQPHFCASPTWPSRHSGLVRLRWSLPEGARCGMARWPEGVPVFSLSNLPTASNRHRCSYTGCISSQRLHGNVNVHLHNHATECFPLSQCWTETQSVPYKLQNRQEACRQ